MPKIHNPPDVPPPVGKYSHAIEVAARGRTLYVAGQVGVLAGGKVADGIAAQAEAAWANILGILKAAGMGPANLVKVTTFLVDKAHIAAAREARTKMLGDLRPAATLVVIDALAAPEYLIEIEAIAAED